MSEEINIEKIMQEIRQNIKTRGYEESDIQFEDIPIRSEISMGTETEEFNRDEFQKSLDYINMNWQIPYYFPIESNNVILFVKRVIRKLVKFLIYPMNQRQNEMNAYFVRSFNQLRNYVDEKNTLKTQMDNLEYVFNRQIKRGFADIQDGVNRQNERTKEWKNDLDSMQKVIEQLSYENTVLKERLEILSLKCEKFELFMKQ